MGDDMAAEIVRGAAVASIASPGHIARVEATIMRMEPKICSRFELSHPRCLASLAFFAADECAPALPQGQDPVRWEAEHL